METLVIFDAEGFIISQMSGSVREPVGIPFVWVTVPEGKYLRSMNVSGEVPVPVFGNLSKTETALITDRLALVESVLTEMLLGGGM